MLGIKCSASGFFLLLLFVIACKKEKDKNDIKIPAAHMKKITYEVSGTRFKLNYIDSNSVFHKNEIHDSLFNYHFMKGSGASIGITINKVSSADSIYSWKLFINDKLYANAFSEGGVYLTVPYD